MDKEQAAKKLRLRDEKAFEIIIKEYTPYISTIIYNITKGCMSVPNLEEVTADVFITLWKNAETIEPETLKGYIAIIAKSRAKDKIRKLSSLKRTSDIEDTELADEYSLSDSVDKNELTEDVTTAVNTLGEPDREIVIRFYYYYQSTPKIAQILGMNADTVKTKLRRAKDKLRKVLEERDYQ